jgi:hypothetical protein
MDRSEFQPQEVSERGEALENTETRALEDATFEPAACLEGMGDYQQAEAIQTSLESVMASLTTEQIPSPGEEIGAKGTVKGTEGTAEIPLPGEEVSATPITLPFPRPEEEVSATPITLPTPIPLPGEEVSATPIPLPRPEVVMPGRDSHQEGPFETAGEEEDDGNNITPINLPGVQSVAGEEIGAKGTVKGTESTAEIPLPGTAGEEITEKDGRQKRTEGAAEIPLPGTAGESGWKEQVGDIPTPIPHPAEDTGDGKQIKDIPTPLPRTEDEIGSNVFAKESAGLGEIRLPGTGGEEITEKDGRQKRTEGAAEIPLPGTAGESGQKEQVGDIPTSIPHPAEDTGDGKQIKDIPTPLSLTQEEIGSKVFAKESAGSGEIRLPGFTGEEIGEEGDPPQPRTEGAAEIRLPGTAGEGMRTGETAKIDQLVVRTQAAIEEMSESFNLQYLQLQNKISHENRQFSMLSNIMKTKHDTAKNSINNIR